jgi:hypothetical protein
MTAIGFPTLDEKDKITRTNVYKSLNFGGVVEWAIDLNSFQFDGANTGDPKAPWDGSKGVDPGLSYGPILKLTLLGALPSNTGSLGAMVRRASQKLCQTSSEARQASIARRPSVKTAAQYPLAA